jgi:uncharacterized protein involved in exopolysaccharide biosynthesis
MDGPAQSYFLVVARYWKLLAIITLVPTILAVCLIAFVLRPVYRAEASVIFPLRRASTFMRRSLSEMDVPVTSMASIMESTASLYNHIAIIESRTLALRVYETLKQEKALDMMSTYPDIATDPKRSEGDKRRSLAGRMKKRVHVDDVNRGLAVVSFMHTNPEVAAAVANAYVDETLGFLNDLNRSTQSDLVAFLEQRQIEVEETLQTAEAEIEKVKEETGILSVDEQARQLVSSYAEIEALVAEAEIEYRGSLGRAQEMSKAGIEMEDYYNWLAAGREPEGGPAVPAIDALSDQAIARMRSQLGDLELKRQETLLWATPENPALKALELEIEALRRELFREFTDYYDAAIAGLMVESSAYQAQLDVAERILDDLDTRLDAFPPEERRLIELDRERKVQESIYLVVTEELVQARIQEKREEQPFTVLDEALVPTNPVRPRRLVITVGTFAISFWVGILVIFAVDASRRAAALRG